MVLCCIIAFIFQEFVVKNKHPVRDGYPLVVDLSCRYKMTYPES